LTSSAEKRKIFSEYLSPDVLPVFEDQLSFLIDSDKYTVFPGFCDVHVHFREPGFSYKETIFSGSRAAAHGGYTTVCTMPNLAPVPDSVERLRKQLDIIEKDSVIEVFPYGSITVDEKGQELSDMEGLAPFVCGFSDDGHGVQKNRMMKSAMKKAAGLGKVIAAHCEDDSLLRGGVIHEGRYAAEHGIPGICSESEWKQIERDAELCMKTGVSYHVCHISTKESVQIIRDAKAAGADITCETAPHYLVFTEDDLRDSGEWKMNPPLRTRNDREALIEGIADGTIDMISTDHAPHSAEEKSGGLLKSPFGIVGIETSFSVLYTKLVKEGVISLEKLVELMSVSPRKRFGLRNNGFCVWDLSEEKVICSEDFLSKGKSSPFCGMKVSGECVLTVSGGKTAYIDKRLPVR
jgi:dihydroorotase